MAEAGPAPAPAETEPRWLSGTQARMWRAYLAMRRSLDLALDQQLAEFGLSTAEYALLVPLSESAQGVLRARELARAVGWDRSRLSHQLRRMEQRGLLRRFDCPTDARGTMIEITLEGRRLVERAAPGHVETVRRHFVDLLSPDELDTLTRVSEKVTARERDGTRGDAMPGCGE